MNEQGMDQWASSRADPRVYRQNKTRHERRLRAQLLRLRRVSGRDPGPDLIDIGCGSGHLLEVAAALGYRVIGLDVSMTAVAELAPRLRVMVGDLDAAPPPGMHDVACALNVLEHSLRPSIFLRNIGLSLRPAGFLLLETPTADGLWHRVNRIAARLLGRPLEAPVAPSGHRYLFNPLAIRQLLDRAGFEVVAMRGLVSPYRELLGKLRAQRRPAWFIAAFTVAWCLSLLPGLGNRLEVIARPRPALANG
jgi:2-polyprenyl-6-hydroxyphenyl methylase/3-demethylubiquinone-9 3-methyltransferase